MTTGIDRWSHRRLSATLVWCTHTWSLSLAFFELWWVMSCPNSKDFCFSWLFRSFDQMLCFSSWPALKGCLKGPSVQRLGKQVWKDVETVNFGTTPAEPHWETSGSCTRYWKPQEKPQKYKKEASILQVYNKTQWKQSPSLELAFTRLRPWIRNRFWNAPEPDHEVEQA